jgi:hypothetical protein
MGTAIPIFSGDERGVHGHRDGSTAPLAPAPDGARDQTTPRAWTWAALMRRAFAIDLLACAHCEGRMRLIATLRDPAVIRKLLAETSVVETR